MFCPPPHVCTYLLRLCHASSTSPCIMCIILYHVHHPYHVYHPCIMCITLVSCASPCIIFVTRILCIHPSCPLLDEDGGPASPPAPKYSYLQRPPECAHAGLCTRSTLPLAIALPLSSTLTAPPSPAGFSSRCIDFGPLRLHPLSRPPPP
jgi:hypothetical protein